MVKLKPCKCKNPKEPEYFVKRWKDCVEHIYVCPKCNHFGTGFTEQEAIDDWNKRSVNNMENKDNQLVLEDLFCIKTALVFMFTVSIAQGFIIIYLLTH